MYLWSSTSCLTWLYDRKIYTDIVVISASISELLFAISCCIIELLQILHQKKRIYFSYLVSSTITCLQCRGTIIGLFSEDSMLWLKPCFKAATIFPLRTLPHSLCTFFYASNYNTILYFILLYYIPLKHHHFHYKLNTHLSHSKKQKYFFSPLLKIL